VSRYAQRNDTKEPLIYPTPNRVYSGHPDIGTIGNWAGIYLNAFFK
jgi:hypothetical protein